MSEISRAEIRPCDACAKPIGLVFFRVNVQRFVVDASAVREAAGLETMLGSPTLAEVMGSGRPLAQELDGSTLILCQDCARDPITIEYKHLRAVEAQAELKARAE